MTKITVYAPTHNYARYLDRAVESVLHQTMEDWELIIIDDGSTDGTPAVLEKYRDHPKIRIIHQENKGLNVTNNIALRLASGRYVIRLDADDYFDENALLVLSNVLDRKPDVGLVFPDWYEVDEEGQILEMVRRKKIGSEAKLLDLPAHGACTMFRKDVLLQLGGYIEDYTCQDGYEMWIKFIRHFKPYNVNIPLFYYRQHGTSLTTKQHRILNTRRQIKKDFIEREFNGVRPKVLGLIPVAERSDYQYTNPFTEFAGKPLIWYTLEQASAATALDRLVLSTRNKAVEEYVRATFPSITVIERPALLKRGTEQVARHILGALEEKKDYRPDAVCTLYISTPLRRAHHIDWAVDTMQVFGVDTVISVQEELAPCYRHEKSGLSPFRTTPGIRTEREAVFKENGAIFLTRSDFLRAGRWMGDTVGHVTMLSEESVKINSDFEFWLAERILLERTMTHTAS